MNEDDRFSVLAIFQTLKAKTSRLLDPVVQSEGLTLLQACVLGHLYQQDAAVGDISGLAVIDQANASSLCKKLEQEGYLTRTRRASDRRVVILSLTPKGREAAQRLSTQFDHYLELLNALPNDAKEELVRGYLAANQMLDYLFEQTKGDRKPC